MLEIIGILALAIWAYIGLAQVLVRLKKGR